MPLNSHEHDNPPYFRGWNPMKILSFGHRRRLRRHGATCRTSPSSVSPRMPNRSKASTKREAAEWMGFGGCLFGKKSDVCLGFYKGRQWKIWDFTRKNGEVIKIIDKCVNQCYLGVSILDLPHSDRFNMMLFEHRIPSHLMVEVLPIYRQTH